VTGESARWRSKAGLSLAGSQRARYAKNCNGSNRTVTGCTRNGGGWTH